MHPNSRVCALVLQLQVDVDRAKPARPFGVSLCVLSRPLPSLLATFSLGFFSTSMFLARSISSEDGCDVFSLKQGAQSALKMVAEGTVSFFGS